MAIAIFLLAFALVALLIILKIGLGPLQEGQELIALFGLGAQGFKIFQNHFRRLVRRRAV